MPSRTVTVSTFLREFAFLWFGPGGSLVLLDAFARELSYGTVGWLPMVAFLLVHNTAWFLVFFPRVRERLAKDRIAQWIVVGIGFGVWTAMLVIIQKLAARKLPTSGLM